MSRIKIYKHNVFVARKTNRYPITQCGIIYVSSGQVSYKTKTQPSRTLKAGEFTVYHSDQIEYLESHCDDGQFYAEIVTFEPSLLRQFCNNLNPPAANIKQPELQHVALTEQHYTAQKILAVLLEAKKIGESSEATLEALAQALLSEVLSIEPGFLPIIESACNQRTAEKVIAFIEINIENDVSLESTAHFLGMSIATLKRRLAAENLSFSQILKIKRVNYAATKLRLSNKSIADIATESGFKSAAHFSTAFKGVQGMTPKEFRQHVKP